MSTAERTAADEVERLKEKAIRAIEQAEANIAVGMHWLSDAKVWLDKLEITPPEGSQP